MRKVALFLAVLFICTLCGCSSDRWTDRDRERFQEGYFDGFKAGYDNGYDDGFTEQYSKYFGEDKIPDELNGFYALIYNLMYDHEYETVKKLMEYYPEGVATALELEFGVTDITAVISYLEELSQTVVGNCEICGEPVYADEFFLPAGEIECAHRECVNPDSDNKSAQINKE